MTIEDCYFLGTITRTHGLKGDLVAKLDTDSPKSYNKLESVFINVNGIPVPFFIEQISLLNNNFAKIKFKNYPNFENLIGKDLYLPLITLPELEGKQFYYHEVINFTLTDHNSTPIGNIIEINDQGPQTFFITQVSDNKSVFIPIINDWIIEIDRNKKVISMSLPEGLIDL